MRMRKLLRRCAHTGQRLWRRPLDSLSGVGSSRPLRPGSRQRDARFPLEVSDFLFGKGHPAHCLFTISVGIILRAPPLSLFRKRRRHRRSGGLPYWTSDPTHSTPQKRRTTPQGPTKSEYNRYDKRPVRHPQPLDLGQKRWREIHQDDFYESLVKSPLTR